MSEQFVKAFNTEHGQVVYLKTTDDDGCPCIECYTKPRKELGVCTLSFSYSDSDEGYEARDDGFEKSDQSFAEKASKRLFDDTAEFVD